LRELTLSANPRISSKGWARFAIAVAHSSQLRVLNLDYNPLGDQIAAMLAVAVASSRTLEVLDLEGTGLTNQCSWTWWRTTQLAYGFWFWLRMTLVPSCNNRSVTCCLKERKKTTGRFHLPWEATPPAVLSSQSERSTSPSPGSPTAVRAEHCPLPHPLWSPRQFQSSH
ncbi:hypothetical protein GOODEAATRI_033134, partial [Goodea atripinnis]